MKIYVSTSTVIGESPYQILYNPGHDELVAFSKDLPESIRILDSKTDFLVGNASYTTHSHLLAKAAALLGYKWKYTTILVDFSTMNVIKYNPYGDVESVSKIKQSKKLLSQKAFEFVIDLEHSLYD